MRLPEMESNNMSIGWGDLEVDIRHVPHPTSFEQLPEKFVACKRLPGRPIFTWSDYPIEIVDERPKRRRVRFGDVTVREYDIDLGDHPYCTHYPIALGNHFVERTVFLEYYESRRHSCCWEKRTPPKLDAMERRAKLLNVLGPELETLEATRRKKLSELPNVGAIKKRIPAIPPSVEDEKEQQQRQSTQPQQEVLQRTYSWISLLHDDEEDLRDTSIQQMNPQSVHPGFELQV